MPIVDTIGSDQQCDLVISDASVELLHATIEQRSGGVYRLRDRGTVTGTLIGDKRILRHNLDVRVPEVITFGSVPLNWPADFERTPATESTQPTQSVPLVQPPQQARPKQPVHHRLSIENLEVWIPSAEATQPILVDASIELESGTVTAILGPSGIGKSTLIRAILGELPIASGTIRIDGKDASFNPNQVSFVPQKTSLIPDMTVRETIEHAAFARMTRSSDTNAPGGRSHSGVVDSILDTLDLTDQADRPVDGLSGGQERRVSIALELVSSPWFLLLDEPSSGLDEGLDRRLLEHLGELSRTAETKPGILVVTHSTSYLHLVDKIIVIGSSAGEDSPATVRWVGPQSRIFEELKPWNYADLMDDLRSGPERPKFRNTWVAPGKHEQQFVTLNRYRSIQANLRRDFRSLKNILKSFTQAAILGFLIIFVLSKAYENGLSGDTVGSNNQFLFFASMTVLFLAFWATQLPVMQIVKEWEVIRREQRWGISARAHIVARILRQIPEVVLLVLIASIAILVCTPTPSVETPWVSHFWALFIILGCSSFASYSIGILIGCMNTSIELALKFVVGTIAAMIFFSGVIFYLPNQSLLNAMSWIFPTRWGVASLASSFDASFVMYQSPESDPLDSLFTMSKWGVLGSIFAMVLIAAITLVVAMKVVPRSLVERKRKSEKPIIQWFITQLRQEGSP